ncbi:uncharacterized protein RCO7_14040 [Rhynchosporium graminicola]|uniref:Uncharacterized protein n=1 Tax=Rhynchosporium graminicola TaxID=2792576 RepID=A0A1E1L3H8_9HELO|nr:uncharacterized protein RCO7_14040 [Rhynchosporium commune]
MIIQLGFELSVDGNQQLTAMLCPKDGNQTAAGCTNEVDDASIPEEWQRIKRREPKSMRRKKREVRREERRGEERRGEEKRW